MILSRGETKLSSVWLVYIARGREVDPQPRAVGCTSLRRLAEPISDRQHHDLLRLLPQDLPLPGPR